MGGGMGGGPGGAAILDRTTAAEDCGGSLFGIGLVQHHLQVACNYVQGQTIDFSNLATH